MQIGVRRRESRLLTRRLRIESTLAVLTAVMALLTIAWPEWIEAVFGIDPDGGSGALEWAFVAAPALGSLMFGRLAWANRSARPRVAGQERLVHR